MMQGTAKKGQIVVIDDDQEMRALLEDFLNAEGHTVTTYSLASRAFFALKEHCPADVIISDIKMAEMDGMEFLKRMQIAQPEVPVILITAFGSIDTAVEAMKNGAYHYVVKPFKLAEISVAVNRALESRTLKKDNAQLRATIRQTIGMGEVLGKSVGMKAVFDLVARVAPSHSNILITGESGSGKERVARLIHDSGARKKQPFIAINCTAIPESLLESELFGHAKGSFTGAIQNKKGLIEEANGGTLFLDEIGDMSPNLQAKLLRVIQERKIRPVGSNNLIDVDVRIIAATHQNLKQAIKDGSFREDLYYRLSVIPIQVPPLRDRKEDIPLLAEYFLKKYAQLNSSRVQEFTRPAMSRLVSSRWEGNVRELENVIERAVVLSQSPQIDVTDLPELEVMSPDKFFKNSTQDFPTLTDLEERYMRLVLEKTSGRKDKAAQILGINRRTLYRKEKEYHLTQ